MADLHWATPRLVHHGSPGVRSPCVSPPSLRRRRRPTPGAEPFVGHRSTPPHAARARARACHLRGSGLRALAVYRQDCWPPLPLPAALPCPGVRCPLWAALCALPDDRPAASAQTRSEPPVVCRPEALRDYRPGLLPPAAQGHCCGLSGSARGRSRGAGSEGMYSFNFSSSVLQFLFCLDFNC